MVIYLLCFQMCRLRNKMQGSGEKTIPFHHSLLGDWHDPAARDQPHPNEKTT
ncbi:hypothetical protein MAR_020249 [Mya arenaria]|uniref:Uncharacterized protein n=1 Tax=Mya arenaria TaxID=6604 RepID=A0ABY7E4E1_MYAAR|nr:hypothetical protein MAR_020249 [Mya arenaria]